MRRIRAGGKHATIHEREWRQLLREFLIKAFAEATVAPVDYRAISIIGVIATINFRSRSEAGALRSVNIKFNRCPILYPGVGIKP